MLMLKVEVYTDVKICKAIVKIVVAVVVVDLIVL